MKDGIKPQSRMRGIILPAFHDNFLSQYVKIREDRTIFVSPDILISKGYGISEVTL